MIFVDTGAFLARYLKRDANHLRAERAWQQLRKTGQRLATSNFVLDETFTLLGRRAGYDFAARIARSFYASDLLEILRPALADELEAVDLFEKYADQEVSFTDCVSFVLMRKRSIRRAFAFDRHFRAAGFTVWPLQ